MALQHLQKASVIHEWTDSRIFTRCLISFAQYGASFDDDVILARGNAKHSWFMDNDNFRQWCEGISARSTWNTSSDAAVPADDHRNLRLEQF